MANVASRRLCSLEAGELLNRGKKQWLRLVGRDSKMSEGNNVVNIYSYLLNARL